MPMQLVEYQSLVLRLDASNKNLTARIKQMDAGLIYTVLYARPLYARPARSYTYSKCPSRALNIPGNPSTDDDGAHQCA